MVSIRIFTPFVDGPITCSYHRRSSPLVGRERIRGRPGRNPAAARLQRPEEISKCSHIIAYHVNTESTAASAPRAIRGRLRRAGWGYVLANCAQIYDAFAKLYTNILASMRTVRLGFRFAARPPKDPRNGISVSTSQKKNPRIRADPPHTYQEIQKGITSNRRELKERESNA